MTPSPLITPAVPLDPHSTGAQFGPPIDGLGPDLTSGLARTDPEMPMNDYVAPDLGRWFLAQCHRCYPDLAEPFPDVIERDEWAIKHADITGHLVHLSVDGHAVSRHDSAMLRYFAHGDMWRWFCPAFGCAVWRGPCDTGQLALAAWRRHAVRPVAVLQA